MYIQLILTVVTKSLHINTYYRRGKYTIDVLITDAFPMIIMLLFLEYVRLLGNNLFKFIDGKTYLKITFAKKINILQYFFQ